MDTRRKQNAFKGELVNLRRTNKRSERAYTYSNRSLPNYIAGGLSRGHTLAPRVSEAFQHCTELVCEQKLTLLAITFYTMLWQSRGPPALAAVTGPSVARAFLRMLQGRGRSSAQHT